MTLQEFFKKVHQLAEDQLYKHVRMNYSRSQMIEVLEDHSMLCYDSETTDELAMAVAVNLLDGTIEPDHSALN
jgi:hypothetical protein